MDSLASLALATEEPTEELLKERPYGRDEYIVSRKMVKHILGMAIWQSTLIFIIIFAGEFFIPESEDFWKRPGTDYIMSGRPFDWEGNINYGKDVRGERGPSRHMTIVFNAFVLMQVFNMITARKIKDELNICKGVFRNSMFVIVFFVILIMQCLLTQFTQDIFDCCRDGLDGAQWGICFAIGVSVFPINFLLKFFPDALCPKVSLHLMTF